MKYVLATFSPNSLNEIRQISEDELNKYKINEDKISEFSKNQELFEIVKLNHQDYQTTSTTYFNTDQQNPCMDWSLADGIKTDINRLIINFLSSFRTFLDHFDRTLSKQYGNDSQIYLLFKKNLSYYYDNCFAYRFLYHLRNYTQHCDLPIHSITFSSELEKENNSKTNHVMKILLNRDKLLNNYDKWKSLIEDISKLPDEFEISPLLDEMMNALEKIINTVMLNTDFQRSILESVDYFYSLMKEGEHLDGDTCIIAVDEQENTQKNLTLELLWIPFQLMQKIDLYYIDK